MVGLCRLCASLRKMEMLVVVRDEHNEICEKLRRCCALNIQMNDALPKSICPECIESLNVSHKFYIKVKEAQDTLQSLYPSPNNNQENEEESVHQSIVQTLVGDFCKENPKSMPQDMQSKNCCNAKVFEEVAFADIELENYVEKETNDVSKQCLAAMNDTAEISLSKDDNTSSVCNDGPEMIKKETTYRIPNNMSESFEENLDLGNLGEVYLNDEVVCEQQEELLAYYNDLEEKNEDVESEEVIKQLNNIVSGNEIYIEVEYMDDGYEDEEQCSEIEIEQFVVDRGQMESPSSLQAALKLNSWKAYKFICFKCDATFSNFYLLKCHIEQEHHTTHIDKLLYKCYDCKKIIPRYNFFLNHVRSKHHNDLKLRCDVCDLSCQSFKELSSHRSSDNCLETENYPRVVQCSRCFKSFHNVCGLQNHCKFQHDSLKTKVKYKCTQCNKELQYKSCLKTHEQLHTDTKKFSCSYCGKLFSNKLNLEQHLFVHVDDKSYQCNICFKNYKTYQTLNEHQKLHTNEKPYKCDFCDKCFGQKVQKVVHERSHTGETPYSCNECPKRFRHRSALNAHNKIHSGDKPYSCDYCDKTFADSSNRNKHTKRMHLNGQ